MNEALRPQMAKTRHNISSIMGFIGSFSAHPTYSASKRAAQISMKAAAARYGPQGVRVNIGREEVMVRLGGAASPSYVGIFRGLQAHFLRHGIELDWVIYSNYDALVEAFARREIDLAWNAPLAYVKTKRRLEGACQVVAMRDVDVNFTTHFIANADSVIAVVQDLKGKRVALEVAGRCKQGCCRTISCNARVRSGA